MSDVFAHQQPCDCVLCMPLNETARLKGQATEIRRLRIRLEEQYGLNALGAAIVSMVLPAVLDELGIELLRAELVTIKIDNERLLEDAVLATVKLREKEVE